MCWLWPKGHIEWKRIPLAEHHCSHYTESWTNMNKPWHMRQWKLKEEQKSETQGQKLTKKKAHQKTVLISFNDMHLHVPLSLAMVARNEHLLSYFWITVHLDRLVIEVSHVWKSSPILRKPFLSWNAKKKKRNENEHADQLWPSRVLVIMSLCSLHEKQNPCCLCPLPIASRCVVDQYQWVRFAAGCLVFLNAFFSCLFRVADRHTLLVSCLSEHHPRKKLSSAPSRWCSLNNSRKERHGVCEIHVLAFLGCDCSEWRVTASGFPIARLSRRNWCALPVSICSSLSCRATARSSASTDPFHHWQHMRVVIRSIHVDCWILKLVYPTDPQIPKDRPTKVCEKTVRF